MKVQYWENCQSTGEYYQLQEAWSSGNGFVSIEEKKRCTGKYYQSTEEEHESTEENMMVLGRFT